MESTWPNLSQMIYGGELSRRQRNYLHLGTPSQFLTRSKSLLWQSQLSPRQCNGNALKNNFFFLNYNMFPRCISFVTQNLTPPFTKPWSSETKKYLKDNMTNVEQNKLLIDYLITNSISWRIPSKYKISFIFVGPFDPASVLSQGLYTNMLNNFSL